jgi:hypothetical protein
MDGLRDIPSNKAAGSFAVLAQARIGLYLRAC